jgi:hypothetical protein
MKGDDPMVETAHSAWREALTEITSRRTVLGASLLGAAGALTLTHGTDAKKKKRKKRCKNGAKRCGKNCCKTPSVCSAATCFCTGNEGICKSIPAELVQLIADALGVPPEQIGANPGQPLEQCPAINPQTKENINNLIEKEFGVKGPIAWCEGGINAGVEDILGEITIKA